MAPCAMADSVAGMLCGTVSVPEDSLQEGGRHIQIFLTILPATGADPEDDPIVVLAGGPGQAGSALVAHGTSGYDSLRVARDIIFVDQRGTGRSNPLRCAPIEQSGTEPYRFEYYTAESVAHCRQQLSGKADLRAYTTPYAADDLERIRQALGYRRLSLDAGSYGTRVALVFLRRHPSSARSAFLTSVSPTDHRNPLPSGPAGDSSLAALVRACAADSLCARNYPDVKGDLERVRVRLRRAPVIVYLPDSAKDSLPVRLTEEDVRLHAHLLLLAPSLASHLPNLLGTAARGDYAPFAGLARMFGQAVAAQMDFGMHLSVVCAEDIASITEQEITQIESTLYGDYSVRDYQEYCARWPKGNLPADFYEPVTAPVPTLILAGEFDPITPPWLGRAVAARLPRSRFVMLPGGRHMLDGPCTDWLRTAFFQRGTTEGLDVSCAEKGVVQEFAYPKED